MAYSILSVTYRIMEYKYVGGMWPLAPRDVSVTPITPHIMVSPWQSEWTQHTSVMLESYGTSRGDI